MRCIVCDFNTLYIHLFMRKINTQTNKLCIITLISWIYFIPIYFMRKNKLIRYIILL